MPTWLKPDEAARYLDIEPSELAELTANGEGPKHYRKGPLVRFSIEDLDAWVEAALADQTPENSTGWEAVAAGTMSAAGETKPAKQETPARDLRELYIDPETGERVIVPAPEEVVQGLLGPDGRPVDRNEIRIATRGQFVGVGDYGNEFVAPDPTAGIPQERLAGTGLTPPHVVESCVEDQQEQRRLWTERMSRAPVR